MIGRPSRQSRHRAQLSQRRQRSQNSQRNRVRGQSSSGSREAGSLPAHCPQSQSPAIPQSAQVAGSARSIAVRPASASSPRSPRYTPRMRVTVQVFASLAEQIGARELTVDDLPEEPSAGAIADAVVCLHPQIAGMRDSLMFAVNAEYVSPDHRVSSGDSIALIPPVSGGSDDARFRISAAEISADAMHRLVDDPAAGAVSLFLGVVRDNNLGRDVQYLEYDAYPDMAVAVMRRIEAEMRERFDIIHVAMHHRTGRLEIGEASVAVAVSSAHRADGIQACHYGIDRLKAVVPIWKKEVWTDGEEWIEGSLAPAEELPR